MASKNDLPRGCGMAMTWGWVLALIMGAGLFLSWSWSFGGGPEQVVSDQTLSAVGEGCRVIIVLLAFIVAVLVVRTIRSSE